MIDPDSVSEGTAEIMQAHHRIKQLEQELHESKETVFRLSYDKTGLEKECAELRAKLDSFDKPTLHRLNEIRELMSELGSLKAENASLREHHIRTFDENVKLQADLASAREEVAKCHEVFGHESDKLGAEIKRLSEGLGKVKEAVEGGRLAAVMVRQLNYEQYVEHCMAIEDFDEALTYLTTEKGV